MAAATWVAAGLVALTRRTAITVSRGALAGAAALAGLAVLSAFSIGWSPDPGAAFTDVVRLSAYLGGFVLLAMLLRPGSGRSVLAGVGAGLTAIAVVAIASRLAGLGGGDAGLVADFPSSSGRLSFPVGYWNALGGMAAMAVPILVWGAASLRGRVGPGLVLAAFVPVLLAAYMTSSRGALMAAGIGAGVAIASSPHRGRSLAVLLFGALAAVPAVAAASIEGVITELPWSSFGRPEATVLIAAVLGVAVAALVGPAFIDRIGRFRIAGLRMRHVFAAAVVALVALVLLVGPGEIAGDFAAKDGRESVGSDGSTLSVSGSGRAQFWSAALDAFASEPGQGIGSGGFETWWNREGGLETPAQNAHSEPLELLAELGPAGLLAFVAFFVLVGWTGIARAHSRDAAAGAALGLLSTAMIGFLIDWTWDVPAVVGPVLIAAAVLLTGSLDEAGAGAGEPARPAARLDRRGTIPAPAVVFAVLVAAIPAVWAGGVLAVSTERVEASADALALGQLDEAAGAARSAIAVEPWSAEGWLQLASVEQAAGNSEASLRATEMAIDRSPDDFRSWLLASVLHGEIGDQQAAVAYANRAVILAPLVLPRVAIEPGAAPVGAP